MQITKDNSKSDNISLTYTDKKVFSDIIRSIQIKTKVQPEYISVKVNNKDNSINPILYSDNDYVMEASGNAVFTIPLTPPTGLEFTYGTANRDQTITVELIYYSQEENCYYSTDKIITTEGLQ